MFPIREDIQIVLLGLLVCAGDSGLFKSVGVEVVPGETGTPAPRITVTLDQDGSMFIENKSIDPADLTSQITEITRRWQEENNSNATPTVVVSAHADVDYKVLIMIMESVRQRGIQDIALTSPD